MTRTQREKDRAIVREVCRWFDANARELPWRRRVPGAGPGQARRDPYRSLVSEFMLQQTQVSRVLEKFGPFLERFPTLAALAMADEQAVMSAWSGMGYYRRARHLHAAAKSIVSRFGGRVPPTVQELETLPGVGRYTAGAVASIVYGRAEPIVDGNVARVLMRVEGKELAAAEGVEWAWQRAGELVQAGQRSGWRTGASRRSGPWSFNEGLMELGALVCTPRGARCGECPLRGQCRALAMEKVDRIPRARPRAARRNLFCAAVVVEDTRGRMLVERRAEGGMWAGLWQAPTLEGPRRAARHEIEAWIGLAGLSLVERFSHPTTHRRVEFDVWRGRGRARRRGAAFKSPSQITRLALSNAQRRVLLGVVRTGGAK